MSKKRVVLTIDPDDVAIILKSNGDCDVHVPTEIHREIPDHVITSAAVIHALQDHQMCDLIHAYFEASCKKQSLYAVKS